MPPLCALSPVLPRAHAPHPKHGKADLRDGADGRRSTRSYGGSVVVTDRLYDGPEPEDSWGGAFCVGEGKESQTFHVKLGSLVGSVASREGWRLRACVGRAAGIVCPFGRGCLVGMVLITSGGFVPVSGRRG